MEGHSEQSKEQLLLRRLGNMPKMMVHNHGRDNLAEFVLHDLCDQSCFDISKAAYFVNNPDFQCLKGIAGYHRPEAYHNTAQAWHESQEFSDHMQQSAFNQQVRGLMDISFNRGTRSEQDCVEKLADALDISSPQHHAWNLKHDNHGLLIYEQSDLNSEHINDHLLNYLHLLGFCPVF